MNEAVVAELKQLAGKRDLELGRLREQRDQYQIEINERKAKEQHKSASALEFRALAEARAVRAKVAVNQAPRLKSQQERIAIFESENKRLKTRIAASAGDEDLMKFFWQSSPDASYADDLKRRLSCVTAVVVFVPDIH